MHLQPPGPVNGPAPRPPISDDAVENQYEPANRTPVRTIACMSLLALATIAAMNTGFALQAAGYCDAHNTTSLCGSYEAAGLEASGIQWISGGLDLLALITAAAALASRPLCAQCSHLKVLSITAARNPDSNLPIGEPLIPADDDDSQFTNG